MSFLKIDKPLIVIVGPTCVGKTEVSIYLAEKVVGEIISADSRTFYKGLNIGTAKPSKEDQTRVPHHLVDVANPGQTWSLTVFQNAAQNTIQEIYSRNHLPFLVGGTGQYIRSITNNWSPPIIPPNPGLRDELEQLAKEYGNKFLHDDLTIMDPEAANLIDSRNVRRTIRALEVILSTGQKFSSLRRNDTSPYKLIIIGLTRPRLELYERIDLRIANMFANGLLDEVRFLLESGISPELPAMSAIGYRECVNVLTGVITEEQAIQEIKRKTRIFVRRQSNWFKLNDPEIFWFDLNEQPVSEIEKYLKRVLKSHINP
jgi:tRNA dimethylallyltransferase